MIMQNYRIVSMSPTLTWDKVEGEEEELGQLELESFNCFMSGAFSVEDHGFY